MTEFLRLERKQVPGRILSEADRLECLFFGGFDSHFEGDGLPAFRAGRLLAATSALVRNMFL